jgi:glycosyltransferase involved in cell wall biosynthesis
MKMESTSFKKLVILTTHFGTNYSGGSTATHEIFFNLQNKFEKIIVICREIGNHQFFNIRPLVYRNSWHAFRLLKSINNDGTLFYGDFYNSIWYVWTKKNFCFTYHDNWPEMIRVSKKDILRSLFYLPVYQTIFRNASKVIVVSEYKKEYVSSFSSRVYLVRNGFNKRQIIDGRNQSPTNRILMVGNIERRKYKLACLLFRKFDVNFHADIHIYGNILDKNLAEHLDSFRFVRLMKYQEFVPYENYQLFLHTSMIENLPLAICESLYFSVPVVAFDVGGISEVVNETNGILIQPFDLKKMHSSVHQIIGRNSTFSFKKNDLSDFDWKVATKKYAEIIL